ncbi:hypothetical protein KFK09_023719 [Dendrobium nobile]|uniref:HTH myb-type domain-containing protein n=1 Tax=Dendrobium nobile TaxID=94219 RepID=A0A8T3ABQ9_DENNO|nr:hypothetical protein KFK09_023719 [Dendrobium nobile]
MKRGTGRAELDAKARGENDFSLWRIKIKSLLVHQGLADAISEENLAAVTSRVWAREMQLKAYSTILLSLGDEVLREVAEEASTLEACLDNRVMFTFILSISLPLFLSSKKLNKSKITAAVPGKTLENIKHHYEFLVEDVYSIESGRVPLPNYSSPSSSAAEGSDDGGGNGKKGGHSNGDSNHGGKGSRLDHERRKGIAWTEEEHSRNTEFLNVVLRLLFLLGLDKYGKGDWRSISRNFVVTRTPTQVASHAQKYFIRLNSMNKYRRRSSIHDITNVNNGDISTSQGPITGQVNNFSSSPITSKAIKKPSLATASAIGQPLSPAIGTPVAYAIRPAAGVVVAAGAQVRLAPTVAYPMHNASSSHR